MYIGYLQVLYVPFQLLFLPDNLRVYDTIVYKVLLAVKAIDLDDGNKKLYVEFVIEE